MKATIKIKKEVEIKYLQVKAGVRYYEDAEINGFEDKDGTLVPCKIGELWSPLIDIDNGTILNWKPGTIAKIHYKVCDDGEYQLLDNEKNMVKSIEGYVPRIMCPEENGYGDYIIMNIDGNGKIAKWTPIINDFFDEY